MSIIAIPNRKFAIATGSWKGFGKSRLSTASYPSENDIAVEEHKQCSELQEIENNPVKRRKICITLRRKVKGFRVHIKPKDLSFYLRYDY